MARPKSKNVGIIGLGIIGSRIAATLRKRNLQVFVWNRTPRPEQNFVGSAAEVAELCDLVQIFVADDAALLDVANQLVPALTGHHIIVAHCTVAPESMRSAAQIVERRGARFLEAPFTGSKVAAENGQLVYYIGGDEMALKLARPILEMSSKEIIPIGEVGTASVIKVATNIVTAATAQIGAEALAIVRRAGISGEIFSKAMKSNASNSTTLEMKVPMMLAGDFDPHFSVKHMLKDVRIAARLARQFDLEVPMTEVASDMLLAEMKNGRGDADYASVAQRYFPVSGKPTTAPVGQPIAEPLPEMKASEPVAIAAEPKAVAVPEEEHSLEQMLEKSGPFAIEPEEPEAEESPAEEEKPAKISVEEPRLEAVETAAGEAEEPKPGKMREEEPTLEETQPMELRAEEPKPAEPKTEERDLAVGKLVEIKSAETQPLESEVKETEPEKPKPEERDLAVGRLVEIKPAEATASKIDIQETRREEPKPQEPDLAVGKLVEIRPAEDQPAEIKIEETRPEEPKPEEPNLPVGKLVEITAAEDKPQPSGPAAPTVAQIQPEVHAEFLEAPEAKPPEIETEQATPGTARAEEINLAEVRSDHTRLPAYIPTELNPEELPPIRLKIPKPEETKADETKPVEAAIEPPVSSPHEPEETEDEETEAESAPVNLSGGVRGWLSRFLSGSSKRDS